MTVEPDPYRTLGLSRGATLDEVRRAYRRLAKVNHPDAAGEGALPRFLAIQAAYDAIVGPGASSGSNPSGHRPQPGPPPRRPWEADPSRADATHRAYGGRSRRSSRGRGARDPGPGPARSGGPSTRADDAGSTSAGDTSTGGRAPNKATFGSTSYDGADDEPFEPDWGGASWYGTTSGTYWTLNPKEYADPRKHGPEYQARARRQPGGPASMLGDDRATTTSNLEDGADRHEPAPSHTTASWWTASSGDAGTIDDAVPPADPGPARRSASAGRPSEADSEPIAEPMISALRSLIEDDRPGVVVRVSRAVVAWSPIALGIGWLAGEWTGCARFAASCDAGAMPIAWFAQVLVLAVFLVVPALASIALIAAISVLIAAVLGALLLSSLSSPEADPAAVGAGRALLGATLVIAWLGGLAVAIARLVRDLRRRSMGPAASGGATGSDGTTGDGAPTDPARPVS